MIRLLRGRRSMRGARVRAQMIWIWLQGEHTPT
jgi:hypothetical protein